ncbi:MFS general substrate transporter [Rhizodiscina lignyota]|uniref:MFS general substrate transporter n=1 Tax=Rhizodiscina lignyota TaxID=1504668 RepID=A0A9P4I4U9_9PEZI|nr:MFS general substrate transporter [Rhizodiscina lignyota]
MVNILDHVRWFYRVFGLASLYNTGRDAWLIIIARTCRMLAFGTNSLVLALFFSALEFSDWQIGMFMTLTLLGDVLLSLFLTLVADRVGRRRVLFWGSVLMVFAGVVFAIFENFWILLLAAVLGVMSATGTDFGPFRAIEESTLSHLTTPATRSDVLSWYVTTSTLGSSIGTEVTGRVVHYLEDLDGWTIQKAYHTVFWVYSGMGIVNMIICLLLSSKCEVPKEEEEPETEENEMLMMNGQHEGDEEEDEQLPLPEMAKQPEAPKKAGFFSKFSQISKATRSMMYKLWFLLIVDSLADGMASYPFTNYYMDVKFKPSKSTLGDVMSVAYFLSALSTIFAAPLAHYLGLINTMVFTHLPSSTAVLLFPAPSNFPLTVVLLLIRAGLNNMDQAPRSAFIAAVVKPEERTAAMGITAMLRTLASTAGPTLTGLLAENNKFWIAFVVAGALRIAYDLGLFVMFVNVKLYEHEEEKGPMEGSSTATESRRTSDEEEAPKI